MRGDIWGQQALQAQGRALYGSLLPLPSADRTNARTRCRKGALSYVRHNVMALRTGLPQTSARITPAGQQRRCCGLPST